MMEKATPWERRESDGVRDLEWTYLQTVTQAASRLQTGTLLDASQKYALSEGFNANVAVLYLETTATYEITRICGEIVAHSDVEEIASRIYPRWAMLVKNEPRDVLERSLLQACGYRGDTPRIGGVQQVPFIIAAIGAMIALVGDVDWVDMRAFIASHIKRFEGQLRQIGGWAES